VPRERPRGATFDKQRETSHMATWEYHVEQMNISDKWSAKRQREEVEAFRVFLNSKGAEGWEMVSYDSVPLTGTFTGKIKGYAYLTFFKRPTG
jgi:Domain of unknown function (DUF4177)